jgi:hypothetical protein
LHAANGEHVTELALPTSASQAPWFAQFTLHRAPHAPAHAPGPVHSTAQSSAHVTLHSSLSEQENAQSSAQVASHPFVVSSHFGEQ